MSNKCCLACGQPLLHCLCIDHYPGGRSDSYAAYVCHNAACALYQRGFRQESYESLARKRLVQEGRSIELFPEGDG